MIFLITSHTEKTQIIYVSHYLNFKVGYRIQDYNFDYFNTLNPFGKQSFLNQGAFVGVEVNF